MQPQILSQTESLFLFGYIGVDGLFYGTRVEGIGLTYDEPLCELSQPNGGKLTTIRVFYEEAPGADAPDPDCTAYCISDLPSIRRLEAVDPFWFDPKSIFSLVASLRGVTLAGEPREDVAAVDAMGFAQVARTAKVYDTVSGARFSNLLSKTWPTAARMRTSLAFLTSRYFKKTEQTSLPVHLSKPSTTQYQA